MSNAVAKLRTCCYCERVAGGQYAIHRDGFGVGPEVPLCSRCAEDDAITCEVIWAKTAVRTGRSVDDIEADLLRALVTRFKADDAAHVQLTRAVIRELCVELLGKERG